MPLLSARVLVPAAIVVTAWGGAHLLVSRGTLNVQPAVWPGAATSAPALTGGAPGSAVSWPAAATPAPSAAAGSAPPLLPGALQQLNGDTRDTALGLYALITDLEGALSAHLRDLARQLEPGR